MFEDTLNKHHTHRVVIIPRFVKRAHQLKPGLYCEDCARLIKWLKPEHAKELVDIGVEKLMPTKEDKRKLLQQECQYVAGGWK